MDEILFLIKKQNIKDFIHLLCSQVLSEIDSKYYFMIKEENVSFELILKFFQIMC